MHIWRCLGKIERTDLPGQCFRSHKGNRTMRVLHITDQMPGYLSGGQLGILQFSYAWTRAVKEVDYVGPIIEDEQIRGWYRKTVFFDHPLTRTEKVFSVLRGQFSRNYQNWKKLDLCFDGYDLIYIDSTKMSYALKTLRKCGYKGTVVVRAHNVEADFFKVNFMENKSLRNFIQFVFAKPREKYMVKHADRILAITAEDKQRLMQLYGIGGQKILVCPVGVNLPHQQQAPLKGTSGSKIRCLITGSMWFGPNASAAVWFVEKVFPMVKDICSLTVAGYRPNQKLRQACREKGVVLIDSPESMKPIFESADMVLAPIFKGGGMKVKIAEAMSYGLPVVTTKHGIIGYELTDGENVFVANTEQEFAAAIRRYASFDAGKKAAFLDSEWNAYCRKYSMEAIRQQIEKQLLCDISSSKS